MSGQKKYVYISFHLSPHIQLSLICETKNMDAYNKILNEYENRLKNFQYGYVTTVPDIEVNDTFPSKPPAQYQSLFDCRLQLLLHEDVTIGSGETKSISTCCIIMPNHGWVLSTLSNPSLNLIFQEQYVRNIQERVRLCVTITNIENASKYLPRGICVGYLLMK